MKLSTSTDSDRIYFKQFICFSITMILASPTLVEGSMASGTTIDSIVVTGTRITGLLKDIPNSTAVIHLEDIEARADASVIDLMRDLPGVHVIQPSGQGGVARLFLRGGAQELTMILLDGVRVNDPNDTRGSAFDFSTLNMNDIERIEIVRGPQSAVYGSDALAGVINVISKGSAEKLGGAVQAETGSDDFYRGALEFSGPINNLGNNAGGFSVRVATVDDGEPVGGTTFKSDSVTGKITLEKEDKWDLRLFWRYSDNEGTAFPEDSGGFDLATIRDTDQRTSKDLSTGIDAGLVLNSQWSLNFLATWYDHDSTYSSPGVVPGVRSGVPPNGAEANLKRTNIAAHAVVNISDSLSTTFGADYYKEDGFSNGFVEFFPGFVLPNAYEFDRTLVGYFAEIHYNYAAGLTMLASVRRDDARNEPGETTSKLGLLYAFNQQRTTIRANWGQGFKLPGFFALSSPLVGNPDLRPEQSESVDIGMTHWFIDQTLSATVTLFHNEFTNLIDFDSVQFRMLNRDEVTTKGIEMEMDYSISENLSLYVQATYLDIKIKDSDMPLRQIPDWRGGVSVRWIPAEHWLLDTSWLYVDETFDSSIPTGDLFLDPYHRVDATATWSPTTSLDLVLAIDNILDEKFNESIGFPSVGRQGRLGLRFRF